jgi:hypothetical protein
MRPFLAVVITLAVCIPMVSGRTWTDSTGKHTTEAEFVKYTDGKVQLKKDDGSVVSIPIQELSEADQEYVRLRKKASEESASTKKVPEKPNPKHERVTKPKSAVKKQAHPTPEELTKLERVLLTPPTDQQGEMQLLTMWRQHLRVSIAFQTAPLSGPQKQPGLHATIVGLTIKNLSPCRIRVVADESLNNLLLNGDYRANGEWNAEPDGTLLLAAAKKLPQVSLPYGGNQRQLVDSVSQGCICRIDVEPTHTDLKPMRFSILYEYGTLGSQIVCCDYELSLGAAKNSDRR